MKGKVQSKPFLYYVLIKKDGKCTPRAMYVPHEIELMTMSILCHVISLLRCNQPDCAGNMQLLKLPRSEGLLSYFVLHCGYCHFVVAEFSSSLHIGESPIEAVNKPLMAKRRPNEVNFRALLAVHSISMSWRDFLLVCALMDLPVPGRNLTKLSVESFGNCTSQVCQESMSLAASQVASRENAVMSKITGVYKFDVSFDATWHRRGHYSIPRFRSRH